MPAINLNMFTNTRDLTKDEFLKMVKDENFEVYPLQNITKAQLDIQEMIEKGEKDSLSQEELTEIDVLKADLSELERFDVLDEKLNKHVMFVKAKSGIYKDTPENQKINRVGQKYESKKEE